MEQKNETVQENLFEELIAGIDVTERTEWENETRFVSENIRSALAGQLDGLRSQCDTKFLDYCNCLKSLLTVYNFGNLASEEEIEAEGGSESEAEKRRKITENDKKLMKDGVKKVLDHVKNRGYDLTPYLNMDDCLQIFGNSDNTKTTIPVTLSAATVMTTLVYFRRLCKRKGLYSSEELGDLNDRVAEAVAEILYLFAKVIVSNGYMGWGFTLDSKQSVAVTLNDTYAVVDAISRFDDAFNQDDKVKRDEEFLLKVSQAGEALGFAGLIDCCINAIFRTAFNTYQRDKDRVYGRSIFYTESVKRDRKVSYEYRPITIEQIASSNRSSALFNPLYVAMITMYGYNEKELVIRRFMDDYALAKQYYTQYEEDEDDDASGEKKGLISAYAKRELSWLPKDYNFKEEAQLIINEHAPASSDYDDSETWKRYYNIARVFQKFVETQLPNDLMKIEEYRNYLNATKDAIDQVQIAYRKFDDSQRLGIVDTDYVMFSSLDINDDPVVISKLNKANISVNYLRPLLLSAKIMIVNALIKYPQSDMGNLYNAIKDSKHRKIVFKKRGEKGATQYEWLWNEDTLDMNSTARHCEAVMYDYFYYFEKYELSYNSLNNLKKYFGKLITAKSVNDDGSLNMEKMLADENMNNFRRVVLNLTRKNVEEVQLIYTQKLMEKDKQLEDYAVQRELERKEYEQKLAQMQENCRLQIEQEREKHSAELAERQTSFEIGDAVRGWIRQEADRHLQDMLAHMILNNINGYQEAEDFQVGYMARGENSDEIVDGNFEIANELSKKIMQSYKADRDETERKYSEGFKSARKMQVLFEGALDDTLKSNVVKNVIRNDAMELSVKNDEVRKIYEKVHYDKRKNNETERKQKIEESDEMQKD